MDKLRYRYEKSRTILGGDKMKRVVSKRFIFEYEWYDADIVNQRMLHIKIFGDMPMQVDLWLDEFDQKRLKEFLNEDK